MRRRGPRSNAVPDDGKRRRSLHYSRFIDFRLGRRGRRSIADSGVARPYIVVGCVVGLEVAVVGGRVTSHFRNGAHTTTDTRAAEGNAARMKDCGQSRRRTTNRAQVCGIMNSPDCPLIPFRARALRCERERWPRRRPNQRTIGPNAEAIDERFMTKASNGSIHK